METNSRGAYRVNRLVPPTPTRSTRHQRRLDQHDGGRSGLRWRRRRPPRVGRQGLPLVDAAPAVPRPREEPRGRPPGDVLGPPVRAKGLPPGRRRRPRGAAAADAPGVALRAQRSLPGLLSPGTRPFANSLPPIIFASIFLGIFLLRR